MEITASHSRINETLTSDIHQVTLPRTAIFDARSGPIAPMWDQRTRALFVAKEGTGANIAPTLDTEPKVEGLEIDNELV